MFYVYVFYMCLCSMCMCVRICVSVIFVRRRCVMLRIYNNIVITPPPATRGQQQGAEPAGCRTIEGWTQQHHPMVGQEDCSRPLPFICRSSRGEWLICTFGHVTRPRMPEIQAFYGLNYVRLLFSIQLVSK